MKRRSTVCPACGGPVEFQIGSAAVTICEFCNSAVARTDKKIEDYGKVADLVQTDSRLRRGLTGRFGKKPFTVVGRVQYAHPAGGVWDEWYLAFPGDRWGWLAYAQGKYILMFQRQLSSSIQLPEYDDLTAGRRVKLGDAEFTVAEKGIATNASAEGDIPWAFHPGAQHRFVDLSGPDGTFATFEYGETPHAFVGKEISLDDLEIEGDDWQAEQSGQVDVAALLLNCPQCAGPLTLHAPDQSLRVTCPSCNSLLDASGGKLEYFDTIKSNEKLPILIPLGTQGTLQGDEYTVIGFLRRFALYAGKTYPWSEYLLYNSRLGFRWLVHNDRHWSFVEPVAIHDVRRDMNSVEYQGATFRIYDRGTAYVRSVMGEFYWRVEAGEQVSTSDYIAPPRMLSFENSSSGNPSSGESSEVNVSLGTYLTTDEVEKAFGVKDLLRPWGVGPIQPRPSAGKGVFLAWPVFLVVLLVIGSLFSKADGWLMFYGMIFVSLIPLGILGYYYSFEVKRWEDSDYSPYASE
jgi:hypothetical protein